MHKSHAGVASFLAHLKAEMQYNKNKKNKSNRDSFQKCGFIVGVQEPPVVKGKVVGFGGEHRLLHGHGPNPRAAVYVSKNITSWILDEYTDEDMATCMVQLKGEIKTLIVVSLYMDILKQAWHRKLTPLLEYSRRKKRNVIILADTNCHSTLWGSSETNSRGFDFEQRIVGTDLCILNRGRLPTFVNRRCNTIIDVTLATSGMTDYIQGWRVHKDFVGSDHRPISFDLTISVKDYIYSRNWEKGDWHLFQEITEQLGTGLTHEWNEETLEYEAERFNDIINKALDSSHPLRRADTTKVRLPAWWDHKCMELKRKAKYQMTLHRSRRTEESYENMIAARRAYTKGIRRAKRVGWRDFTESCQTSKDLARLTRVMQRQERIHIGAIRRPNGTLTEDNTSTLKTLFDTHFTISRKDVEGAKPKRTNKMRIDDKDVEFITTHKILTAINQFGKHKAAGMDGYPPIVLQNLGQGMITKLMYMYKASAKLGYIPTCWRKSRVIFIPKQGKDDYANPRSFRPITLSSFFLKALERVWLWQLEETHLKENPLSNSQHAFRKGYSTESALSNMTEYLEAAIIGKGYAIAAFLDIQGAFDNIPTSSILRSMREKRLPATFIRWYDAVLNNRSATAELGTSHITRKITKGTPQGGVLSPLAWNLCFEDLLTEFDTGPVKAVGFADDAALVASGDEPGTIRYLLQRATEKAVAWGNRNNLKFSAAKTSVVIFTNKRKYKKPTPITIGGVPISYTTQAKYLGVTLDHKLSWRPHITQKIKAGKQLLFRAKQAIGKLWGPSPRGFHWIYTGIVRPALTYGSLVWGHVTTQKTIQAELRKMQRLALMSLGNFRRSTPTAGIEIITGTPPLDLWIRMEAALGYMRTKGKRKLDAAALHTRIPSKMGHREKSRTFLEDLGLPADTDVIQPMRDWNKPYTIDEFSYQKGEGPKTTNKIYYFTDGSKIGGSATGAAFVRYQNDEEERAQKFCLNQKNTVFQAEILAITEAARSIEGETNRGKEIEIYSDSQAALKAIAGNTITSKMVWECAEALRGASAINKITLRWVKAHVGQTGNERADCLAKEGAMGYPNSIHLEGLPVSNSERRRECKELLLSKWTAAWLTRSDCRQTKQWFLQPNMKAAKDILSMNRKELSSVVQVVTGHNFLGRHCAVVGDVENDECRLCMEDEESSFHIVAECPALAGFRREIFGYPTLASPLVWSNQMRTFLRGRSIVQLLDLSPNANDDEVVSAEGERVVE